MTRGEPVFVVQKHAATSLHYDFRPRGRRRGRLVGGAEGPVYRPARQTPRDAGGDHPLDWRDFEGVIGERSYGAGAVIVWDSGWYENLSDGVPMDEALRRGHVRIWLHGRKLSGGYTLRRTSGGAKPKWLLTKRRDAEADARRNPASTQPESVLSGRTVEEVAAEAGRQR